MNRLRRTIVSGVGLVLSLGFAAPAPAGASGIAIAPSAGSTPSGARAPLDWPQFRFDDAHSGVNPFETTITRANAPSLSLAWQAQL